MQTVGRIRELWRYPVKSMGGENIPECLLTAGGVPGDRAWALRDEAAGEIRGAKKLPALLRCSARFVEEPRPGESPVAEITFPDGRRLLSNAPEAAAHLTQLLGRDVTLWPLRPADDQDHYRRGLPDNPDMLEELKEIFGREEGEPLPDLAVFPPEIMEFTSPLGTYFDVFPLHFVTTATLAELGRMAPASSFDVRRFRPNFVIDTLPACGQGLVEAAWSGRELKVGEARIRALMPTVRCSMITQPQGDLAKDPGVLRTVVRGADQNAGSYAIVLAAGMIRVGDPVVLLD